MPMDGKILEIFKSLKVLDIFTFQPISEEPLLSLPVPLSSHNPGLGSRFIFHFVSGRLEVIISKPSGFGNTVPQALRMAVVSSVPISRPSPPCYCTLRYSVGNSIPLM